MPKNESSANSSEYDTEDESEKESDRSSVNSEENDTSTIANGENIMSASEKNLIESAKFQEEPAILHKEGLV